ncbi:MAG: aminopeptidase [Oscillospiraceae bacterium]|nr:aminopeptidase [Oscillospiraceae bacterium]
MDAKELKEKLCYETPNAAKKMNADGIAAADSFSEGYMNFLDAAKTEREAVTRAVEIAEMNGFSEYDPDEIYPAGSKIYYNNRGKSIILSVIGEKGLKEGARIIAAHIDSPRLDLRPNPLYEADGEALFKTHYYGGIKKYQWTAIPLALHGVIVKKDGETVTVTVGESDDDPKFVITDLLPHLAAKQMTSTLAEGIKGEDLNVLVGSRPFDQSDEAQNIKLNTLNILFEKFGVTEADFLSAELEIVPAFKACDIGFDRSMIGAYGHDDRVCAYPALMALLDTDAPAHTTLCVLTDKEEIGSDGNTGLNSAYMSFFIKALAKKEGLDGESVLSLSKCLSADVNAAYDPDFPEVYEKSNSSFINKGVVITKYTGSRGKGGSSDASAEFMAEIRALLDNADVCWQIGELGRLDAGGGGTVAKYVASHNIEVVDVGVPVLSMHAPFEVVSKLDVYSAYRAFYEFYKS